MRSSKAPSNQSLDKALRLLDELASKNTEMSINEICEFLNISKSTAYSMIQSFLAGNYVERNPETRKYTVGYKFYEYGMAYRYRFPFLHVASKHMQHFAQKYALRVTLAIPYDYIRVIQIFTIDTSPLPDMEWGYTLPSYASAVGKVLLAYMDQEQVEKELSAIELRRFTPTTDLDVSIIMEKLKKIPEDGYYVAHGEYNPSRICIAAPLFDVTGRNIAAVCFQVSKIEEQERLDELIEICKTLAQIISAELGYNSFMRY